MNPYFQRALWVVALIVASSGVPGLVVAQSSISCPAPATGAFTGCYYVDPNLTTLGLVRTDAAVNFDWVLGSPAAVIPADNFSAKWEGNFWFNAATYTFSATVDGGRDPEGGSRFGYCPARVPKQRLQCAGAPHMTQVLNRIAKLAADATPTRSEQDLALWKAWKKSPTDANLSAALKQARKVERAKIVFMYLMIGAACAGSSMP